MGNDPENVFVSNEKSGGMVGVTNDGWKGVGVGLAFEADVINTKGRPCSGAGGGALEEEIMIPASISGLYLMVKFILRSAWRIMSCRTLGNGCWAGSLR